MHRSKLPLTGWFRAAHLVTTRLSDYRHDPRVALVGPYVLSFRCQGRSQAESTARRAYGLRSMATDRPAIAPMAGNLTEQRGRIKLRSFEFNSDRRKYVTTAKPLSIPQTAGVRGLRGPESLRGLRRRGQAEGRGLRSETVGYIPSVRFQFERISVSSRFSTSFMDNRGTRIDPAQTELRRDT
jgi:hypothetical protein